MAIMKRLSLLAFLVFVATCSGCYSLNVSEIDGSFTGIRVAVDRSKVVNILIVHGMGGYSSPDPQQIIDATVSNLNLCSEGEETRCNISRPDHDQLLGYLLRQDFKQMDSSKKVRFYTLHWSNTTRGVKKKYVGYDNSETEHRLGVNHRFKRDLVNQNLSDVVLYLGGYKDTMLIPFEDAINIIDGDVPEDGEYELILISFSLGSIMLLDTVEKLVVDEQCASKRFCEAVSTFFMLANQVPLLLMGNHGIERPAKYEFATSLQWFVDLREPTKEKFAIVAMSDPNDLLSYPIPDWLRDQFETYDPFVNVTTSVSRTAWVIPFVGAFTNPAAAHRNYGRDERVLDLIVNGYDNE